MGWPTNVTAENLMAIPAGEKLLRNLNLSNALCPDHTQDLITILYSLGSISIYLITFGVASACAILFRIMDGVLSNQLVYIGDILISEKDEISIYRCYEELLRSRVC